VKESPDPAVREIISRVLDDDPEGQSLLAEAGHRRTLAQQSAQAANEAAAGEKAARRGYEALRHRLDPRNGRPLHIAVASVALTVVVAALLGLDRIEFTGFLIGWMITAAAVTAAAAWTGCAWLAALAVREERHGRLTAIGLGATVAGLLLAVLHSTGSAALRWPGWDPVWVDVLLVLVILALVTIATEIIARTEPPPLLVARRRWHRAQQDCRAAVRTQRSDAEAAAVAAQNWCSLVDIYATAYAANHTDGDHADANGAAPGSPPGGNGYVTPDPWSGKPPM
jgi:MFS family permease